MGGMIIGIILILVGLSALTGFPLLNVLIAAVLIAFGIRLIMRRSGPSAKWRNDWQWHGHGSTSNENEMNEVAVFSSLEKNFTSEHFRSGKITAVFSSVEIDLTQAKCDSNEIDLYISSVFSSVEIVIPKNWSVNANAARFLGDIDVRQAAGGDSGDASGGSVTVNLHGEAVFGEIEIRRR